MADEKFNLSRRKTLAAMGTIGAASAGAGLGTSAFFSDQETFEDNQMVAGTLNLKVGWQQVYYGGYETEPEPALPRDPAENTGAFVNAHPDSNGDGRQSVETQTENGGTETVQWPATDGKGDIKDLAANLTCDTIGEDYAADYGDDQDSLVVLDDIKPGDGGQITFDLCLCDNPGYIWLFGKNLSEDGGTNPEPEQDAEGDDANDANLAENLTVYVAADENCNSQFKDADQTIWQGTLQELIDFANDPDKPNGALLSEDCFEGGTCHCFNVGYEVPQDVGNEIQGDSVSFDLGFYTEQCRHNENPSLNNTDIAVNETTSNATANASKTTNQSE